MRQPIDFPEYPQWPDTRTGGSYPIETGGGSTLPAPTYPVPVPAPVPTQTPAGNSPAPTQTQTPAGGPTPGNMPSPDSGSIEIDSETLVVAGVILAAILILK